MTKKYNPKELAAILFETTEGKSDKEVQHIIAQYVTKIGATTLKRALPQIMTAYQELQNKKEGIVSAQVILRERGNTQTLLDIKKALAQKTGAKEIHLTDTIDQRILGGFKVYMGDSVFDASVLGRLNRLSTQITH